LDEWPPPTGRVSELCEFFFDSQDIQDNGHYNVVEGSEVGPTARNVEAAFLLSYPTSHTRRAYASDLGAWFEFCDSMSIDPLAANRAHFDAWARKLAEIDGRTPATVARKLSASRGSTATQ
jgi:hypothetical protein